MTRDKGIKGKPRMGKNGRLPNRCFLLDIANEIGELVETKNISYGNSFAQAGDFLRLLYPDGITVDKYGDALLLVRIFDKMKRIATDKDALGEDPYRDIAGYGILAVWQRQQK